MGNTSDKPTPVPTRSTPLPKQDSSSSLPYLEKDLTAKSQFYEAIKKRDLFLFKKTLQTFNVKPTDIVGPPEQQKTVLHKLAESNFSEAMALVIQVLSTQKPETMSKVLNVRDSDGNTPLLLCCLSNSVETLEVLAKDSHVDMEAKNAAKKTALEIAIEMESPCVNVLTCNAPGSMTSTKATLKSGADSPYLVNSLEETSKGSRGDGDFDSQGGSHNSISSLGGKKGNQLQSRDSKELKELRDSLRPDVNVRLPEVMADLDAKETNFVDSEFPHETCYLETEQNEGQLIKKHPELQWKRPLEFLGPHANSASVFDMFKLGDISKSPLSGSEMYSALAVMAEFPQRLSRVFTTKEINKQGVYGLKFTIAGIPIEILLDDYFPCIDSNTPLYSKPEDREMWFILLEKAFAKLYGGYGEIANVGISEALEALTGMPVAQFSLTKVDEDRLWRKLVDYDKKNYIICAGETKKGSNANVNRVFNIVSLIEYNEHRLLKMRNHFGQYYWNGDFSGKSQLWTKELKDKAGYIQGDKSSFYMSVKDLIKEFDYMVVCHYHDNWVKAQLNVQCEPKHFNYFEFNVDREVDAYISVHQKQPEFVEEGPLYNISPVEMIMARDMDGNNLESIAFGEQAAFLGKPTVYLQDGLESKLKPGRYILAVKVKWVDGERHDFYLNVLSSTAIKFSQLDAGEMSGFLEKVYLGAGTSSKDKFEMTNGCELASGWVGSHLWICAFNRGTKTWSLEINFDRMQNIKIAKKFRNAGKPNSIKITLQPSQKSVAYVRRTSAGPVSMGWSFNQSWE